MPRHAHGLPAVRAAEIAVFAVPQPGPEIQQTTVLPLTLVDITGEHAEQGEAQQSVYKQREDQIKIIINFALGKDGGKDPVDQAQAEGREK